MEIPGQQRPKSVEQFSDRRAQDEMAELRAQIEQLQRTVDIQQNALKRLSTQLMTQAAALRQLSGELSDIRRSRTWHILTTVGGYFLQASRIASNLSTLSGRAKGLRLRVIIPGAAGQSRWAEKSPSPGGP